MAVSCSYCFGPHPTYECRKKPDGWKHGDPDINGTPTRKLGSAPILQEFRTNLAAAKKAVAEAKSTAALMEVHATGVEHGATAEKPLHTRNVQPVSTQASPVDTYPRIEGAKFVAEVPEGTQLLRYGNRVLAAGPGLAPSIVTMDGLVPLTVPLSELKMGGRPKTMTPEQRKEYKRLKEQERRDDLKAQQEGKSE